MNSIAVYFTSEIIQGNFPFSFNPNPTDVSLLLWFSLFVVTSPFLLLFLLFLQGVVIQTHSAMLLTNLIAVALFHLGAYYMYCINFFVKI
jgi:hypothetical protein